MKALLRIGVLCLLVPTVMLNRGAAGALSTMRLHHFCQDNVLEVARRYFSIIAFRVSVRLPAVSR